jgi:hypothetical protein
MIVEREKQPREIGNTLRPTFFTAVQEKRKEKTSKVKIFRNWKMYIFEDFIMTPI